MNEDTNEESLQRWEKTGRIWDRLVEDADGHLADILFGEESWESEKSKRKLMLRNKSRGLIRSVVILIDLSEDGLSPREFNSPRIRIFTDSLINFAKEFFDANPLSQMAIVGMYEGKGHLISPLCGSVDLHIKCLKTLDSLSFAGDASLQNGLIVGINLLKTAAKSSTKEILVIYGSLHTCDAAPLEGTITNLKKWKFVVNVIGFGASVFFLKNLAEQTGGTYFVPLTSDHFVDLLMANNEPPEWSEEMERVPMVPFGFAQAHSDNPAFDLTEIMQSIKIQVLPKYGGYTCPNCHTRIYALPVYCPVCDLLVITPGHITRSTIHKMTLEEFIEVDRADSCACCTRLVEGTMNQCPKCANNFCKVCNEFIHDQIRFCPCCKDS